MLPVDKSERTQKKKALNPGRSCSAVLQQLLTPKSIQRKKDPYPNLSVLDESDVRRLLPETLTADVQAILANQTSLVCADTALPASLSIGTGAGVPNILMGHIEKKLSVVEKA
jgi:hypothetical protein